MNDQILLVHLPDVRVLVREYPQQELALAVLRRVWQDNKVARWQCEKCGHFAGLLHFGKIEWNLFADILGRYARHIRWHWNGTQRKSVSQLRNANLTSFLPTFINCETDFELLLVSTAITVVLLRYRHHHVGFRWHSTRDADPKLGICRCRLYVLVRPTSIESGPPLPDGKGGTPWGA